MQSRQERPAVEAGYLFARPGLGFIDIGRQEVQRLADSASFGRLVPPEIHTHPLSQNCQLHQCIEIKGAVAEGARTPKLPRLAAVCANLSRDSPLFRLFQYLSCKPFLVRK